MYQTLDKFSLLNISHETLIEVFIAAALVSMPVAPEYIDIKFYDKRENDWKDWNELAIVDYFVDNNVVFIPKGHNDFVIPFKAFSNNEHYLVFDLVTNKDTYIKDEEFKIIHTVVAIYVSANVGFERGETLFIGLLHLKTDNLVKAEELKNRYKQLYGKNEANLDGF